MLSPDAADELEPRCRAALSGSSISWDRATADRVFSLTAGPVRGTDGEVFAGMVVCADVTAERQSERIARALHAIATVVANNAPLSDVVRLVAEHLRRRLCQ